MKENDAIKIPVLKLSYTNDNIYKEKSEVKIRLGMDISLNEILQIFKEFLFNNLKLEYELLDSVIITVEEEIEELETAKDVHNKYNEIERLVNDEKYVSDFKEKLNKDDKLLKSVLKVYLKSLKLN